MIRKFFLVDDDKDDTELFADALNEIDSSIEFNYAFNCKEQTRALLGTQFKPQIIFLDINMPGMSGWECLEALKEDERTKDIPVIMYSTSSPIVEGKKAIKFGAVGFYEKPASFAWLKEFLQFIFATTENDLKSTLKKLEETKSHRLYVE
jgi:CheY-like chemotaxis protein